MPSVSATDCAAADIDRDGYVDLGIANNNHEDEKSVYIYWGGAGGLGPRARTVWKGGEPRGLKLADLNGDGRMDLLVFHGSHAQARDVLDRKLAHSWTYTCETAGARECVVEDFNKDGHPDVAFADEDSSEASPVYFGSPDGFSKQDRLQLPTRNASDVAAADFNGDGWLDLIAGGGWNSANMGIPPQELVIAWRSPEGYSRDRYTQLEGFDPIEHCVADINKDSWKDLMVTNHILDGRHVVGTNLFWGSPDGFSSRFGAGWQILEKVTVAVE